MKNDGPSQQESRPEDEEEKQLPDEEYPRQEGDEGHDPEALEEAAEKMLLKNKEPRKD